MSYSGTVDLQRLAYLNERRNSASEMLQAALSDAKQVCGVATQVQRDVVHMRKEIPLNAKQVRKARDVALLEI